MNSRTNMPCVHVVSQVKDVHACVCFVATRPAQSSFVARLDDTMSVPVALILKKLKLNKHVETKTFAGNVTCHD